MKITNTNTEDIVKLLCRVMESKEGQADSYIIDEFEKQLKQSVCQHRYTECIVSNFNAHNYYSAGKLIEGSAQMIVEKQCTTCYKILSKERYYCDVAKIEEE